MQKTGLKICGLWKGYGKIIEKGIPYYEELVIEEFKHSPCIILNLVQKTYRDSSKSDPLHLENGILKIFPEKEGHKERKVEGNYSHPFSLNEYAYGEYH